MRARTALQVLWLAALAVPVSALPSAAGPWAVSKGEWFSSFEGSVFSAPTVYDQDGHRQELGYTTEQRALRSYSEIGWKKKVSILLGLPAVSVTRSIGTVSGTATGLQDAMVGMRLNLVNGASAASVQIDWTAPLGYDRKRGFYGQLLGDGVLYVDSLGNLQTPDGLQQLAGRLDVGTALMGRGFFQGSIGYGYRYYSFGKREKTVEDLRERDDAGNVLRIHTGSGLWSTHLLASADLGVWVNRSVLVGGRYRGTTTGSQGPLMRETSQHLAGAIALYRVDDHLDMFAGSWSTAAGKNVLHYDQAYVGVAFHQSKLNRLQGFSGSMQTP